MQANGTFEYQGWDELTWDGQPSREIQGAKLTHARIRNRYSGDIEGEGVCELLMSYAEDGSAIYTGFERITGTLGGRSGSFVMQTQGGYVAGAEASADWSILPGSGTDQLRGLVGTGRFVAQNHVNHTPYTIEYDFE